MVLPVLIAGGAVGGSCAAYATYHTGEFVATTVVGAKASPPMTGLGVLGGAVASIATYNATARALASNATYAKWTTFSAPANVNDWNFKDFARTSGPYAASRFGLVLASVAAFGFTRVVIDAARDATK
ncbi:hypothetical protein SPRG_08318 [Saprolegnia parasitica CBS 223.65]|uniref:Uncharacterized protein n=1 Tax=Saprolegnia parasitica (strain CBS 223.65) TaxID=695850 RepID=A0A067C6Y7_SAPPC|nr:hypothetical protein SPRG_08318 [Saprolegnia parasitica CBS 223.65]KDO26243.1 hypothetical protein SPRG_08318 [Saprolegnia parasitica CBS 223.65]|eukprot:XP_012202952.1 hypothetical protein SPRG_08318 [Saprolegnia parasitica CBS 223.65]